MSSPLMNKHSRRRTAGFTLIELMVGMIVGLIVLSAVLYIFLVTVRTEKDIYNASLVLRETSALNDMISGELRRAGYNSSSTAFSSAPVIVHSSDCIAYTYDKDESIPGPSDDGYFGFRLDSGNIEYGTSMATGSCTANWNQLNPDSITVTSLAFSSIVSSAIGSSTSDEAWYLDYSLEVEVAADTAWKQLSSKRVKIRNDIKN